MAQAAGKIIGGNIGHDDHKLVAIIAHKQIGRVNVIAYNGRDDAKHQIADTMAISVVDHLKIIEVNDRHATGYMVRAESFIKVATIANARHHIGVGRLLICHLLLIDRACHK